MIPIERMRSGDVRVVVSVSGGKDSTATALHMRDLGIPFNAVFADTGWESEITYRYLRDVLESAIGPITWVRSDIRVQPDRAHLVDEVEAILGISPSPMVRACISEAAFSWHAAKWCTRTLKVEPLRAHHHQLMADGRTVVSAVGIRASESAARASYEEWEISDGLDTIGWRPILRWTEQDVFDIHQRHGLRPNPLYSRGMPRVGCWPCIHARKSQYAALDDRRVDAIRALEHILLDMAVQAGRGPGTTYTDRQGRTVTRRAPTWAAGDGRTPTALPRAPAIDVVRAWAAGTSGDPGIWADGGDDPDSGCVRWGLCERSSADTAADSADTGGDRG